ncbi:MAG: hypothetical protein GX428_10465 [Candidatus Atribacteria bacterium]|nr:hypothetical protein [Candidatus Atribacteria bacterium]
MEIELVTIDNPNLYNFILGQTHFIKSVEDIYEAVVGASPSIKFGLAFCEASGPCLVRCEGNDVDLIDLAAKNALKLGCGHSFILFLKDGYPINILNAIKMVPEVCRIFCATANPCEVIIASSHQGHGVMGVIDGFPPKGIESEKDKLERQELLQKFGYKR